MKKKLVSSLKTKRSRGLSLIEISASLVIMAMVSVSMAVMFADYTEKRKAKSAAEKMTVVHEAANGYIKSHYSELMGQTTGNRKVVIEAGRPSVNGAVPNGSLQRLGLLPTSYVDRNAYGQGHALIVRQVTPAGGGNPYLEAIVTTHGGQPIPASQLGTVSSFLGVSGGYVGGYNIQAADQNMIVGTNGGWRSQLSDWNNAQVTISSGTVQSTLAFENGNLMTDYLYRNEVPGLPDLNTMNTAINMAGNNVRNAGEITANSVASNNGLYRLDDSGLQVVDVWARHVTASGNLRVNGAARIDGNLSAPSATIPTLNGNVTVSGNLTANENLNVNKKASIDELDLSNLWLTLPASSTNDPGYDKRFMTGRRIQLKDLLPRTVAQYSYQVTEDATNFPNGIRVYKPVCGGQLKGGRGNPKIMLYRQIESSRTSINSASPTPNDVEIVSGIFATTYPADEDLYWYVKWEGNPPVSNSAPRSAIAQTFCSYE